MPELGGRGSLEQRIARFISRELARIRRQTRAHLAAHGLGQADIAQIPPPDWDTISQTMINGLARELEAVYLRGARAFMDTTGYQMSADDVQRQAEIWADARARLVVLQMNTTSQQRLTTLLERYFEEPTSLAEFERQLAGYVFAPSRGTQAAITEITRAAAEGQEAVANDLRANGVELRTIWQTVADDRVCPICGPRQGQAQGTNWYDLPPAHVGCRCFTTYEVVALAEKALALAGLFKIGMVFRVSIEDGA